MTDLTLPAGTYTLYVDGTVSFRNRSSSEVVSGSAPEPFTENDWSIELTEPNSARIKITSLPQNNGQTIGYTEYRVNNGDWISLNAPRGSFVVPLANVFSNQFELRAVNFSGASDPSDTKIIGVGSSFFITTANIEVSSEILAPTLTASYPITTSNILLTTEITTPSVSAVAPVAATLVITEASYSDGGSGSGPSLNIVLALNDSTGPYTVFGATHANGTTLTKTNIENGTGNAEDAFDFSDADGVVSNQIETLSTGLTNGHLSLFIRDTNGVESGVFKIDNVNVDATANTPTSVSGTKTGSATATWAATLDEAGGTMYAVAYEDGDTAPSAPQIIAGTGGSIVAANSDTTPTADGANGGSFTGLTGSTTYRVATVYVDDWGNTSAVATSTGTFTTDAASSSSYSRLTSQFSSDNTTNPSFTIDLSGFLTGDRVIVWTGNVGIADSATFNGSSMTKVAGASNATGNLGEYITCFEYVLTADGDANETVEFTLQATRNEHFLCGIATSRSIVDSDVDSGRGVTLSGSVTPSNADNIVVAVAMSESQGDGLTNWVGVTERNEFVGSTGRYAAIADAEDVAVSATTVSVDAVTPGSSPDMALSILVLE
jgi:hypothetical protein